MIQRVLTEDLTQRLPPGMVVLPQEPARGDVRQVVLEIPCNSRRSAIPWPSAAAGRWCARAPTMPS